MLNKTQLLRIERFQKKILKQVLSLPNNTSDAAVYILSGFLPAEAAIHKKILSMFYSICLMPVDSVENQLARRQLAVKTLESNSWFIVVKRTLWKYSLPDVEELLEAPFSSASWKHKVHLKVNEHWSDIFIAEAACCKTLKYLNCIYTPGKPHPLIRIPIKSARSVNRIPVKLKLLTGTYILQSTRAAFNQNEVDPMCKLCQTEPENLEHFVLKCPELCHIRDLCFPEIECNLQIFHNVLFSNISSKKKLEILLDCTCIIGSKKQCGLKHYNKKIDTLLELEDLCRRYLHLIHCTRYKALSLGCKQKDKRARGQCKFTSKS